MKVIKQEVEILTELYGYEILKHLELCGRVCYKSENEITPRTCEEFVKRLIKNGHESVLEHYSFSVKFITNRAIANEIVRHRIASFSQESTRYCNYSSDKFDNEITVIEMPYAPNHSGWFLSCADAETKYFQLLKQGVSPQLARGVLPLDLKTELIMTANLREWRHFFKLRTAPEAHPQMRELATSLLNELKKDIPVIFDDINV